eukprot:222841_1
MTVYFSFSIVILCITSSINTAVNAEHTEETELVSINFTHTLSSEKIWPSHGFILQYDLVDNREFFNGIYVMNFTTSIPHEIWCPEKNYSRPSLELCDENITQQINLNLSSCNCDHISCKGCKQRVYLFNWLSEKTMVRNNRWDFQLSYTNEMQVSIVPQTMSVYLQRCNISLHADKDKYRNDIINFHFVPSTNCFSRIHAMYVVDISVWSLTNFDVDLYNGKLKIGIDNNGSKLCVICAIKQDAVIGCNYVDQNSFSVHLSANMTDDTWINYDSNQIDIYLENKYSDEIKPYQTGTPDTHMSRTAGILVTVFSIVFFVMCFICCCTYYANHKTQQYAKVMKTAFKMNKVMVLIIGIAQFDKKEYVLDGVKENVQNLYKLWKERYKYDVFVCNKNSLYSTKNDVMAFIDAQKVKLHNSSYQTVIVHIISHGSNEGNSFESSDHYKIQLWQIRYELRQHAVIDNSKDEKLTNIIFSHICRGENIYQCGKPRGISNDDVKDDREEKVDHDIYDCEQNWEDSNWAVVWGNILSRTLSDDGNFTNCICDVFGANVDNTKKKYFRELIADVRVKLQFKTNGAEICEITDTLSHSHILFDPCKSKDQQFENDEVEKGNINSVKLSHRNPHINSPFVEMAKENINAVKSTHLKPDINSHRGKDLNQCLIKK